MYKITYKVLKGQVHIRTTYAFFLNLEDFLIKFTHWNADNVYGMTYVLVHYHKMSDHVPTSELYPKTFDIPFSEEYKREISGLFPTIAV